MCGFVINALFWLGMATEVGTFDAIRSTNGLLSIPSQQKSVKLGHRDALFYRLLCFYVTKCVAV